MTNVMSISRWEALKRGDVSRTEDGEARNRAYIQWRQTGANHFPKETQDRIKTEQQARLRLGKAKSTFKLKLVLIS